MRQIESKGKGSLAVCSVMALLSTGLFGCSGIPLQSPSVSQESAGVDRATVQAYRQRAEAAQAEADMYERRAQLLDQNTDPKGFIRNSLMTAAQANRAKAEHFNELASGQEGQPDMVSR